MDREQQRAAARQAAAFTAAPVKLALQAWGGDIYVRRLSVADAFAARSEAAEPPTATTIARTLVRRICDEQGTPTFDDTADDVALLASQGVDFLIELQEGIQAIDAPKKPLTVRVNS